MLETLKNTLVSLVIYFILLTFYYLIYYLLKEYSNSQEFLKILRDLFCTITLFYILNRLHIIKNISLSINHRLILIYGIVVILFLLILTKGENSTHSIHTVISAIFLAPIIEEILCREIAYNPSYLLLSFFISSLIFVLLHFSFDIRSIIYFFIISSFLFFLKAQSNSVLNSILLHSLINLIIIIRGNF